MTMELRLYKKYDDKTLLATWDSWTSLVFETAYHGGFLTCRATIPMSFLEAATYLRFESQPGRHFAHLEVRWNQFLRWEGRVMNLRANVGGSLIVTALGYWSSMKDQIVTTVDYSGGSPTADSIIKAFLNDHCPDISATQDGIEAVAGVVNLTLPIDKTPQQLIVEEIAPLSDTSDQVFFFAIWEDREPFYVARSISEVDWEFSLADLDQQSYIEQDASWLRNAATAYDGSSRTAEATDADSQVLYPVRDATVAVPSGTTSARAEAARDKFVAERAIPQQTSRFILSGLPIPRSKSAQDRGRHLSAVRAGDVIRLVDVIPDSASINLDSIRTFLVLSTRYDAKADRLEITPDRNRRSLVSLLTRTNIEPDR